MPGLAGLSSIPMAPADLPVILASSLHVVEAVIPFDEKLHPRDRSGRWSNKLGEYVRTITDAIGVDPYDVDLPKLERHAKLCERHPQSRFAVKSPCWASRKIDYSVHRVLPAMLAEKYPDMAKRLRATSPRWGRKARPNVY